MEILAYTPTTLAEAMHASRPTVYRWMRIPGFPVVRLGGCVRIPVKAFEQWLNEQSGVKIDNEWEHRQGRREAVWRPHFPIKRIPQRRKKSYLFLTCYMGVAKTV